MTQNWDAFIKDEGDMITLGFQTPNAIKIAREHIAGAADAFYGDETCLKLDLPKSYNRKMEGWLVSHNLSWETF